MSYEKPELFVLSLAATSVRGATDTDGKGDKAAQLEETSASDRDGNTHSATTSTTSGAYEADE